MVLAAAYAYDKYKRTPQSSQSTIGGKSTKDLQKFWDSYSAKTKAQIRNYIKNVRELDPTDTNTVLETISQISANPDAMWKDIREQGTEFKSDEELEREQGIEDLVQKEKDLGEEFLGDFQTRREDRMRELAEILQGQQSQAFDVAQPQILEDMSKRGLLHSSAVGPALAEEKSRLARSSSDILRQQELGDLDIETQLAQGIMGREIDIRRAGMEREYSLEDIARQSDLAQKLAEIQAGSNESIAKRQLWGNLLGTGIGAGLGAAGAAL